MKAVVLQEETEEVFLNGNDFDDADNTIPQFWLFGLKRKRGKLFLPKKFFETRRNENLVNKICLQISPILFKKFFLLVEVKTLNISGYLKLFGWNSK